MREFETTFAKGLKKGLREDDENPRNEEALVECLNAKPSEEGLIPIVPITTPMAVSMVWPFPQVFDRPLAAAICDGITNVGYSGDDPLSLTADSTTEVTITNGLPPFTWAVTGTGLSWTYETTRGRTNTLIASGSASGEGSWTATDRCTKETGGDTSVAGWVAHLDNEDWYDYYYSLGGVDPQIVWDGTKWDIGIWNGTALQELGTWVESYRPTHIRITYTGALQYKLIDAGNSDIVTKSAYTSGQEVEISWGSNDIKRIKFYFDAGDSITNIEFYEA